ncbi:hypothetical protein [Isoptericola sp. NPDC057191]|uniref:hypothetical protein n=1 Tax=Isoptericola sp. NPDC057191 TaxID=3346041 RepID=UPI003641C457
MTMTTRLTQRRFATTATVVVATFGLVCTSSIEAHGAVGDMRKPMADHTAEEHTSDLSVHQRTTRDGFDTIKKSAGRRLPASARRTIGGLVADSVPLQNGLAVSNDSLSSLPTADNPELGSISLETGDFVGFTIDSVSNVVASGDAVRAEAGEDSTVVAHATERGMQVVQVAHSADADDLTLATEVPAGSRWVHQDDGSLLLMREDRSQDPIMAIDTPWAVDADGRELPTQFVVTNDGTITQQIDTAGATFPVVADPSAWWWTKNVAVCAAQVASVIVPGKAVAVAAKLARAAAKSVKVRQAQAIIKKLGGFVSAMKKVATYVKTKGKGLSPTNRRRVENLLGQGSAVISEILGLGGCYRIFVELR